MKVSNGLLNDCKPVLTLSAKPELIVLIYLSSNCLIGVLLLIYSSWIHFSIILLIIPLLWMFHKALQRYYFFSSLQSIQSLIIHADDHIELLLVSGKTEPVQLVNKLLINKTICLYFIASSEDRRKVIFQRLALILGFNQFVFVLSESITNRSDFRQVLRRIANLSI